MNDSEGAGMRPTVNHKIVVGEVRPGDHGAVMPRNRAVLAGWTCSAVCSS